MWAFFWRRIWRLVMLAVLLRLARAVAFAVARRIEQSHDGATTTSRALVWVGDTLPRTGHRAGTRA